MSELDAHLERLLELADAVDEHRAPRFAPRATPVSVELLPLFGAAPLARTDAFAEATEDARSLIRSFANGIVYSLAALACVILIGAVALHVLPTSPRPSFGSVVAIHDATTAQP